MKSFLLLLCSTLVFGLNTSESDNFKIKNGQAIWQKVYDTDLAKKQLIEAMKTSSYFEDITMINENKLTAKISQFSPNYRSSGFSFLSTPDYITEHQVKTFTVIEFKDNQYRVTLKSIKIIEKRRDRVCQEITDIEYYILNKDHTDFKSNFFGKSSKILDFAFQKITNLNKIAEDNKW